MFLSINTPPRAEVAAETSTDWEHVLTQGTCGACGQLTYWRGPKGAWDPHCWTWTTDDRQRANAEEKKRKDDRMSKTVAIVTGKKRGRPAKATTSNASAATEVATGTGFITEPLETATATPQSEPAANDKAYVEPDQFCSVTKNHPEPRRREIKNGKPEKWDSKKDRCWGCVMSMRSDHSGGTATTKPRKTGVEATNGHDAAFTNLVIVLHDVVPEAPIEMVHKIATRLVAGGFTLRS